MNKIDDVRRAGLKCKRCDFFQPRDNFYSRLDKEARCKKCVSELRKIAYAKDPLKVIHRVRRYSAENPEKIRDTKLKQTYDINLEKWNELYKRQNGVCAICKQPETTIWRGKRVNLAVDHCHETLEVRGLLCIRCNRAMGLMKENVSWILSMADFIVKSRS